MTLDTEHLLAGTEPEDGDDLGYARESAPARAWSWLRYAPGERVPWATAPFVWGAAEILHAASVNWTAPGLVTMIAASWVYAKASRKAARSEHLELDGPELAAAVGAPGVWLTLATRIGPLPLFGSPPHIVVSSAFGLLYGLGPVWLRRHEAVRGARERRNQAEELAAQLAAEERAWRDKKTEWHRLAPKVGLQGSDLLTATNNKNDSETWEIDTQGARSLASEVNCRRVQQILSGQKTQVLGGWKVPMDRVEVRPHPEYAYHLLVTFYRRARFTGGADGGLIWHPMVSGELDTELPGAAWFANPEPSVKDPVCIGIDPETGDPMLLVLLDEAGAHRILVLGTSGSGKSMVLDTIRERITACRDAVLLQINLAKGTEDKWWDPIAAASALTDDIDDDATRARALMILDFVHDVVTGGRPRTRGQRSHNPAPDEPALVLFIDEVDATANDADRKQQLGIIVSKCRSEGIVLIIGSQRPQDMYVGGGMVRSNLTDLVWGVLRGNDLRQAGGSYGADLPDMNEYGQGNAGVFGVARYPLREGAPIQRGRAFFWGTSSQGLISIIDARSAARGGERPYQQLEPGLAPKYGPQWAQITGNATGADRAMAAERLTARGDEDRYAKRHTRAGDVPSGDARKSRLAALGDTLRGLFGDEGQQPQAAPEQPSAAPSAPAPCPAPTAPPQPSQSAGVGVLPPEDQERLWELLCNTPGGITTRKADGGGLLRRVNPAGGRDTWSEEMVRRQLNAWKDEGKARLTTIGPEARWLPVHLRAVPDPDPEPQAAAPEAAEPIEPRQVYPPGGLTDHDLVMMAASWGLREPGLDSARACALRGGIPPHLVSQAIDLLRHDREYVAREVARIVSGAGAPVPSWAAQELPGDEADEPDEYLDGDGEDLDEGEDPSGAWGSAR